MTLPVLYDACGNLLLVLVENLPDEELRASSHLARHCFVDERRIADGIACFVPRSGFVRSCFFNPDGSFERVCGNSLLVAAALLARQRERCIAPFDHADVRVSVSSVGSLLEASSTLTPSPSRLDLGAQGVATLLDTGSPHAVLEVADAEAFDLHGLAGVLDGHPVNLTVWSRRDAVLLVRTFERGVLAETGACGTGALAVALATARDAEPVALCYRGGRYRAVVEPAAGGVRWKLSVAASDVRALPAPWAPIAP